MNWDKAFESPFKSDVYFFSTRLRMDQKWGTATPITIRDKEFGAVRLRGYGIYSYRIADPKAFYTNVSGTRDSYYVSDLEGQLRNTIVAKMTDIFAPSDVAFVDMAANQAKLAEKIAARIETGVRGPGIGIVPVRGGEPVATGRIAEGAGPAHRHEHGRRPRAVCAIPGGAIVAGRGGQPGRRGRRRAWDWARV